MVLPGAARGRHEPDEGVASRQEAQARDRSPREDVGPAKVEVIGDAQDRDGEVIEVDLQRSRDVAQTELMRLTVAHIHGGRHTTDGEALVSPVVADPVGVDADLVAAQVPGVAVEVGVDLHRQGVGDGGAGGRRGERPIAHGAGVVPDGGQKPRVVVDDEGHAVPPPPRRGRPPPPPTPRETSLRVRNMS